LTLRRDRRKKNSEGGEAYAEFQAVGLSCPVQSFLLPLAEAVIILTRAVGVGMRRMMLIEDSSKPATVYGLGVRMLRLPETLTRNQKQATKNYNNRYVARCSCRFEDRSAL